MQVMSAWFPIVQCYQPEAWSLQTQGMEPGQGTQGRETERQERENRSVLSRVNFVLGLHFHLLDINIFDQLSRSTAQYRGW